MILNSVSLQNTVIFFTQKIATTVSSVQPAKLTQFSEITTTKGVKRPEKLKKGQKIFEGQNKGRIWKKFKFSKFFQLFRVNWKQKFMCSCIFGFRGLKGQKGRTNATTQKVCQSATQTLKIWSSNIETTIYKCLQHELRRPI